MNEKLVEKPAAGDAPVVNEEESKSQSKT